MIYEETELPRQIARHVLFRGFFLRVPKFITRLYNVSLNAVRFCLLIAPF